MRFRSPHGRIATHIPGAAWRFFAFFGLIWCILFPETAPLSDHFRQQRQFQHTDPQSCREVEVACVERSATAAPGTGPNVPNCRWFEAYSRKCRSGPAWRVLASEAPKTAKSGDFWRVSDSFGDIPTGPRAPRSFAKHRRRLSGAAAIEETVGRPSASNESGAIVWHEEPIQRWGSFVPDAGCWRPGLSGDPRVCRSFTSSARIAAARQ